MEERAKLKIKENDLVQLDNTEEKDIPIEPYRANCEYCGKNIVTCVIIFLIFFILISLFIICLLLIKFIYRIILFSIIGYSFKKSFFFSSTSLL